MKSSLVINLIKAHCTGSESSFKAALDKLADDEAKKGNLPLSTALKNAYSKDVFGISSLSNSKTVFTSQSAYALPQDKDNGLELLEIVRSTVALKDVALPPNVLEAIHQIIEEQKKAESLISRGVSPTNRLLLFGPPGCGKTITAYAIGKELGLDIAYVRLDGLVSSYLGQTGTNIRKIFDYVKNKRIILFLDEFDAIAKKRDDSNELGELKRVVTTLLQNLDNLPSHVMLIAATNHEQLLDTAVWRRFETTILIDYPNDAQRRQIIEHNISRLLPNPNMDIHRAVILTKGMNGSDIANYVESLAKRAILEGYEDDVSFKHIVEAWLSNRSLVASKDSKEHLIALKHLNTSGVSLRMLEEITGIPKSTMSYQFQKIADHKENKDE